MEACTSIEFHRLHTADPNIHLISNIVTWSVRRDPCNNVTPLGSSPAHNLLGCVESHSEAGNQEVGECEAHQEIIIDASQLGVENHADDDQQIGEDSHDYDGDQCKGLQDRF